LFDYFRHKKPKQLSLLGFFNGRFLQQARTLNRFSNFKSLSYLQQSPNFTLKPIMGPPIIGCPQGELLTFQLAVRCQCPLGAGCFLNQELTKNESWLKQD